MLRHLSRLVLLLLLLPSCQSASEQVIQQHIAIPVGPEPAWLTVLHPVPGQILSVVDYQTAQYETHRSGLGVSAVPESVCVQVSARSLLTPGDTWYDGEVIARTEISVNGIRRDITGEIYSGLSVGSIFDEAGTPIASVSGPTVICAAATLTPGLHKADISFEKSDGEVEVFAWTFTIIEGPVPTITPFPTSIVPDKLGNFPEFIRTVFPFPGSTVPMPPQHPEWYDLNSVFRLREEAQSDKFCIAVFTDRLKQLGISADTNLQWPERVKTFVDGLIVTNSQSIHQIQFWEEEPINTFCYHVPLSVGSHSATVLVEPFEQPSTAYSWSFEVNE